MPGILRFFLSMLVVFSHLSGAHSADHVGFYAVRAFFLLSGLLLTKALHETYQFDFFRFYSNRLLRIVPLYLLICVVTHVVIRLAPTQAGDFMPRWAFADNSGAMLQNFLLLPLASGYLKLRYLEPAWSLAVELIMYLFLWIGVSRNEKTAILCLSFGLAFHLVELASGSSFAVRYFSLPSALLSYGAGALLYFRYEAFAKRRTLGAAAAALWLANLVLGWRLWGEHVLDIGYYLNTLLFLVAAPFLLEPKLSSVLRGHDAVLGQLSYPVFLVQWLAGFVGYLVLDGAEGRGVFLFYLCLPVTLAMAAALTLINDMAIEPLRRRLRGRISPLGPVFLPTLQLARAE